MPIGRIAILILAGLLLLAQQAIEGESALGKQMAAEIHQRTTPIDNPTVQNYIDHLGQMLAANVPKTIVPFTFSVIAEDFCPTVHEPLALPGGYVFVPAALFLTAQDEAEFAGMLAHAMEHIAERHSTRQATRGAIINNASIPMIFMGGGTGCAQEGVPVAFLNSQRALEREADFLAVQTMAKAGFDPQALVRYTERVQPAPSANASKAYSPMPQRNDRVATMMKGIALLPPATYPAAAGTEFAAAQEEVRRFTPSSSAAPTPPAHR